MSTALFDEPPRVTISDPGVVGGSRAGLLLGVEIRDKEILGILCLEDGSLTLAHTGYFSIDFRYDVETDRFIDQHPSRPAQEG
jgi:hypothetical protein